MKSELLLKALIVLLFVELIFLFYPRKAPITKPKINQQIPTDKIVQKNVIIFPSLIKLSDRQYRLNINLQPATKLNVDAFDLYIKTPGEIFETINVDIKGLFDLCPKRTVNKDSIQITCTTIKNYLPLDHKTFVLAVDFILKKPYNQGSISIDAEKSALYFRQKNLLMMEKNIEIPVAYEN